jgi:RNA polymerase sigma-70 factor (ECF subfamily)
VDSPKKELTDQEAVTATLEDRNNFVVLVDRYQSALLRYIKRLGCNDTELAKDILQESFIKAYVNLNDYDASLSFSSWIYRITHNETISHFRRQKVRPRVAESEEELLLFQNIAADSDVQAEFDIRLAQKFVHEALSKLESQYKDVLILRFLEYKSYDEIADILQIPNGTVATYISRGKQKLKTILKDSGRVNV